MPQLDALRFVAFLMVFCCHALPSSASGVHRTPELLMSVVAFVERTGALGVDMFFTLSAFLITSLFLVEINRYGSLDVRSFYLRRALRIWPLYYIYLFSGFILQYIVPSERLTLSEFLAMVFFIGNWDIAIWGWGSRVFNHLWSLCVEEQFYLLWPLALKVARGGSIRAMAMAMIAISFAARIGAGYARASDSWYGATINQFVPIALGILIATGVRPLSAKPRLAIVLGAVLLVSGSAFGAASADLGAAVGGLVADLGCSAILIGALELPIGAGVTAYLGKISYGMYVFHRMFIDAIGYYSPFRSAAWQIVWITLALALTIIMAILSYEFLESPFLRFKNRFTRVSSRPV